MQEERGDLLKKLFEIQKGRCFIGDETIDLSITPVEIDHIVPRAKGGKDEENNYALVCQYHNRNKSDSDLRVARCMAKYEQIKEQYSDKGPNRPNLGDFLNEFGGAKAQIKYRIESDTLYYSFPDVNPKSYATPIFSDKLSGMRSIFIEIPIEYLHHDSRINPRAVGSRIRGLIEEFLEKRPQLHIALGWASLDDKNMKVHIFDGQHKAVAQILLGVKGLSVRVFLEPDLNLLLEANTNAGTFLRQVAFDKATQRFLGTQIYWEKIDQYRKETKRVEDDMGFSEQDLLQYFKGEHRELKRYIIDDVRMAAMHHQENKLKDYVEFGGRASDKPLSYITIERTIFSMFICKRPLSTRLDYKFELGENPRQLEKEQLVRLMNIIAEEIYLNKYDFDIGASRVEKDLRKGKQIPEEHLKSVRMSREEIFYNWLRYVRDLIRRYFLMRGEVIEEEEFFQKKFSEDLWNMIRKLIRNIASLPLWVNKSLSTSVFGGKQDYDYWKTIFETGRSREGQQILAKPLNLDDLIK